MMWIRACVLLACLALMPFLTVRAQPTSLEVYQTLALGCLYDVPDTARAFVLDAPAQMPYLRTALADRWRRDGRTLFLADSSLQENTPALSRLRYAVEETGVVYARARRKQYARSITLALRYTFTAADGRLLGEDQCRETFTDMIRRADRVSLETDAFPETQGSIPHAGWMRRYLEPAVLAFASAVTVYLFFNLRSDRSDGGA